MNAYAIMARVEYAKAKLRHVERRNPATSRLWIDAATDLAGALGDLERFGDGYSVAATASLRNRGRSAGDK